MNDVNGDDNDDVSVAILCISATAGGSQAKHKFITNFLSDVCCFTLYSWDALLVCYLNVAEVLRISTYTPHHYMIRQNGWLLFISS